MNKEEQPEIPAQEQAAEVAENNTAEGAAVETEITSVAPKAPSIGDEASKNPLALLSEDKPITFAEAMGADSGLDEVNELSSVLGLEASNSGRAKFKPSEDQNRAVAVFPYTPNGVVLKLRRNGNKETEGVTVTDTYFNEAFHKYLHELPNQTQISLQLSDMKMLVGYVKKPKEGRSKVYFPIHCWNKDVPPPKPGFIQRVRVAKLIIG